MNFRLNRLAATTLMAVAASSVLMNSSIAAQVAQPADKSDAALVSAVKDSLNSALGKDANDLAITAKRGNVTLHGWTQLPKQESEARTVASKVPGVKKVFSDVRTWSSSDDDQ